LGNPKGKIFKFTSIVSILFICGAGFIVYSNTLHNSFHFDDKNSIIDNINIRNPSNLKAIWRFWPTRFITYLSIAINYKLGQLNVLSYHLFNIIVHICSAILVWWLVLMTFSTPAMKESKITKHSRLISFLAGLLFVVHPIQSQAVNYIIQRAVSLASLFYLLCLCLYIKSRLLNHRNNSSKESQFLYFGSMISALLAMFSKEMAITLPFMLLLYEFYFLRFRGSFNWRSIAPFLFFLPIIPLTMVMTNSVNVVEMRRITEAAPGIASMNYLLTEFRVVVTYLRLLFVPINQNLDYDYRISKTLFELPTLGSLIFLILIILIGVRLFPKYRLISFSFFWFFLTLLPESSLIPIQDVIVEHRLYLPAAGYALFLTASLYYIIGRKTIVVMTLIAVLICNWYALLCYTRNFDWRDNFTLWDDVVKKSPRKPRPYNERGIAYSNEGRIDQAISDFNKAIAMEPKFAKAYCNRGIAYYKKGDLEKALFDFDKAIEINPNDAVSYCNRGIVYISKGALDKALSDFNKSIEIDPNYGNAYYNRGLYYSGTGNPDKAISDFNKAIEINPHDVDAYKKRIEAYSKTKTNI
jgi:tetratricopeptide (TPR) repeat protein